MSFLSPIWGPLRTVTFAMGGAALAWLWFTVHPLVPVALVISFWLVVICLQMKAVSLITTKPQRALSLFETRLVGITAVSAAAAALVILVTVAFTVDDDVADTLATSTQEVIAAVGAALTAFIGAVALSAEKVDSEIGKYVAGQFAAKFVREGTPLRAGQKALPVGSDAHLAVYTSYEYGWTDWSREHRAARIEAIQQHLDSTQ